MNRDDLCQVRDALGRHCRNTWTRATPHGFRCELHLNVAGSAPRPAAAFAPPAAAPLPPPPRPVPLPPPAVVRPPPRRAPPPRRDVAGELSHNPSPAPGMCCALRDGVPCDRPAVRGQRRLCVGCRKLASRRGILDAVAHPPVPGHLRGKPRAGLDHEAIVAAVAAGATRKDIEAYGARPSTVQRYWRRWQVQAAVIRGCA